MSTHLQKSDPGRLAFRFSTLGATLQVAQDFSVVEHGELHAAYRAGEGGGLYAPAGSWHPGARFVVIADRQGGLTIRGLTAIPQTLRHEAIGPVIGGFTVGADNHPDPASAWDLARRPEPTIESPTATAPEGGAPAMRHAAATHHNAPPPAGCADPSTPELMAIVMRRIGDPTTRLDFLRAPETGHLTEEQLNLNLAKAELILIGETERQVFPLRPVYPWDADPSYRKERIAQGGQLVAEALRRRHYTAAEVKALGPAIVSAAFATLAPEAA